MKLLFKRFMGDVGLLIPIDSKVDDAVAAVAERVFSDDLVYSSLFKSKTQRPKLRLRCRPWESSREDEEFTIIVTPVFAKDFKLFYSNIISLFKRESWPLDIDDF